MAANSSQHFQASRKRRRGDGLERDDEIPYGLHPGYSRMIVGMPWSGQMGIEPPRFPRPLMAPPMAMTMSTSGNSARIASESASQAQTNLIVNYLPQTLTEEELNELFIQYGAIESLRIMRDKKTGYSFGYGFVNYVNPASAAVAISVLNGLQVMNKVIKVSYARPPSIDIKDTNLYITNLPRTTTDEDLMKMFGQFGNIVQKNILYDKYTQLPRGVAFVRYDRREEANTAIEAMNDFIPPGADEPIRVRLAENHGKQKASYVAGFQAGYQKRF